MSALNLNKEGWGNFSNCKMVPSLKTILHSTGFGTLLPRESFTIKIITTSSENRLIIVLWVVNHLNFYHHLYCFYLVYSIVIFDNVIVKVSFAKCQNNNNMIEHTPVIVSFKPVSMSGMLGTSTPGVSRT